MPEEKKKNGMTCPCAAGMCSCAMGMGMRGGYGFRLLRGLFALVILVIIFMLGLKIGELRGMLETHYGGYHMMGGYGQMHPMMQTTTSTNQ